MNGDRVKVNGAAKDWADAVRESYTAVAANIVGAQEHNTRAAQECLSAAISNMYAQAEENRQMANQLAEQQQRRQEGAQVLLQESISVYMDLANSMFSFYGEGLKEAKRSAEKDDARRRSRAVKQTGDSLPLKDYDSLNAEEIVRKLEGMSPEEVKRLRSYEARNKNRRTVMERFKQKIAAGSSS